MNNEPLSDPPQPSAAPHSTSEAASPAPESMIERVRKLLVMAERTTNPNEAQAFSRKAAELIAQHRIDPDRLRQLSGDALTVWEVELGRGVYVRGRLRILQAVSEAHACRVVFQARERGTVAMVAGFESDLATVKVLYSSLHQQAAARMAAERRSTPAATRRWRRAFLFGFGDQLAAMFAETATAAARRDQHLHASALPALQARDERVDRFASERFGRIVTARPAASVAPTGFHAGRRAARRADLGRRRFGGRAALGRGAR